MAFPISGTAAITNVAASPAYTGVFIPELWSGKLLEKFYDATVLSAIANTDYTGEISNMGDTVHIRQKPSLTITSYTADLEIAVERPSVADVELSIDQGRYFAAIVDDVMETQSDLNMMDMWGDDASEQMKINIDTYVLGLLDAGATATENKGAAAGRLSGNIALGTTGAKIDLVARNATAPDVEVIDMILRMGQVLDEQNIPENGRWMVVPAWVTAMIKRSELRDASLTGDGSTMLRNGRIGMIDRFTLYSSNVSPQAQIIAGHKHGLTFASQLTKMETIRSERTFGNILRGLQVFGSKVVDGDAITVAHVAAG